MKNVFYRGQAVLRALGYKLFFRIQSGKLLEIYHGTNINVKRNGAIICGDRVRIYHDVGFFVDSPNAQILIGDRTYINRRTEFKCQSGIKVGCDCAISWDVTIMDTDYHSINDSIISKEIVIGNHVWVGCKATILKGVIIGDGAVIAAGALVNCDVPARTLVGGVPARIIKENVNWE